MIWDFSIIQQKHVLACPGLYRLILESLYHTSLILPKREIDETINFRNIRKLFINKLARFFGILSPHLEMGKTNEVTGHTKHAVAAMYGCHSCTLHLVG